MAAIIAALAAVVGVLVAARQMRQTAQLSRFTLGLEALLRLKAEWTSEEMQRKKRRAAFLLLVEKPDVGSSVADILDFFETVAVLLKREVIDEYLTWHTFYWWMVNFYAASQHYIGSKRSTEGEKQWRDLEDVIPILKRIEGVTELPTPDETQRFLDDERGDYKDPAVAPLPGGLQASSDEE